MVRIVMVLLLLLVPFNKIDVEAQQLDSTPDQMRERMRGIVVAQAKAHNMPPLLLVEVCIMESNLQYDAKGIDTQARYKPRHRRTLADYSYGLCQVKLDTARWVWARLVPSDQRRFDIEVWLLSDPMFNAATAAIFLVYLNNQFNSWRMALAAYNEGPYISAFQLKSRDELSMGKGTYEMTIWTRWNGAKMFEQFSQQIQLGEITLARVWDS